MLKSETLMASPWTGVVGHRGCYIVGGSEKICRLGPGAVKMLYRQLWSVGSESTAALQATRPELNLIIAVGYAFVTHTEFRDTDQAESTVQDLANGGRYRAQQEDGALCGAIAGKICGLRRRACARTTLQD